MKLKIENFEIKINNIQTDSRKVRPNDLFIAYKGVSVDAHDYINGAIEKGASVVIGEKDLAELKLQSLESFSNVKYIKVVNGRATWADLCAQANGYPQRKLKFIAVTGTDGKTTTSTFIYNILQADKKKAALFSTVSAKFAEVEKDTGLHTTSPDPDLLFSLLKEVVELGIEYMVLEVTSAALIQKRVHGIDFEACVVTNITPEHLDLHGTYEQLIKDKALIFNQSKSVFINKKGIGCAQIARYVPDSVVAESKLKLVSPPDGLADELGEEFVLKFPGEYNLQNASLAISVCEHLCVSHPVAIKALKESTPPVGRFQSIKNERGLNVIVDFAHTENAMRNVLSAVRSMRKRGERIITVFGCAGLRDVLKRPAMGKTSSELSDIVILTAEDPRTEDLNEIIKQIFSGATDYPFIKILDRKDAIRKAIEIGKKGDWILILGKGHEKSMNISGIEYPWSDIDVASELLRFE